MPPRATRPRLLAGCAALLAAGVLAGCGTASRAGAGTGGKLRVVAAENVWGSLAAQLGGDKVEVTSIIDNPAADPHDYEPTASDARAVADADLVIANGIGYDAWITKLASADSTTGRSMVTVGAVTKTPIDGNPHRWYAPDDVQAVMSAITGEYQRLDPGDATYFADLASRVHTGEMQPYLDALTAIATRYADVPIGGSESIVTPLAGYLGLELLTPETFLTAISEGAEPTAADKAAIDTQIKTRQIKVYVYNSQNVTPDVQAQVKAAEGKKIPVVAITETLTPANASFEDWQVRQLDALAAALHQATGR